MIFVYPINIIIVKGQVLLPSAGNFLFLYNIRYIRFYYSLNILLSES